MSSPELPTRLYDERFFDDIEEGSLSSARVVVPLVLELVKPDSVIDVGCGRGAWLNIFLENGTCKIRGVDGPHVQREHLLIPSESFTQIDLAEPFSLPRNFGLATSLEVAEHLPYSMSRHLVAELTSSSQVVLFAAAIPEQGGTFHINEQWPSFWADLFLERGFLAFDPFRPRIRDDRRVKWWYRQNLLLFVSRVRAADFPQLAKYAVSPQKLSEWVHRGAFEKYTHPRHPTISESLRYLGKAVVRSIQYRLVRRRE